MKGAREWGGKKESKKGRGQIKRPRQERNRGDGVPRKSKIKREKM